MNIRARIVCRFQGHDERTLTLPEDGWGLYAISRIYCKRCGVTTYEPYPFTQLAKYNAEVSAGIVHEPWFVERMALQQEYWRQWEAARR